MILKEEEEGKKMKIRTIEEGGKYYEEIREEEERS